MTAFWSVVVVLLWIGLAAIGTWAWVHRSRRPGPPLQAATDWAPVPCASECEVIGERLKAIEERMIGAVRSELHVGLERMQSCAGVAAKAAAAKAVDEHERRWHGKQ